MTRTANARLAGFTFLAYIITGIADMVVFNRAGAGTGAFAQLASIAHHATLVRVSALLTLLSFFEAVILGVTLYALLRDEDQDLAVLALCCRVAEGVLGAASAVRTMQILSVATAVPATDSSASIALGASLLAAGGSSMVIGATCFSVGSALFSYLFLRARSTSPFRLHGLA